MINILKLQQRKTRISLLLKGLPFIPPILFPLYLKFKTITLISQTVNM
jgi:hypothetical protein